MTLTREHDLDITNVNLRAKYPVSGLGVGLASDFLSRRGCVTTRGKLFTPLFPLPCSIIWYWPKVFCIIITIIKTTDEFRNVSVTADAASAGMHMP